MAGSDGRRLLGAAAFVACVVMAACAPPIPLERLHCPCLDGYLCCEREQICYQAADMPATCAQVGAAVTGDGGADLGMEGADAADAAGAASADGADADEPHAAAMSGGSDTADGTDAIDRIDTADGGRRERWGRWTWRWR